MIHTENGPKKLTYAQTRALKKRREMTHTVVTDDDAAAALQAARSALQAAQGRFDQDATTAAQANVDAAEAAVRESALTFRLRALPGKGTGSFAALKAEHPPTPADDDEQRELTDDPKAKAVWHSDTFYPALVAACLIEPEVTVDEATEMATDWNEAEWAGLYLAALNVNRQATVNTVGLLFN